MMKEDSGQCLDSGLIPALVLDDDKFVYYQALHAAQTEGRYEVLERFFNICQDKYFDKVRDFVE
ncbi:MAG: hypothetical protein VZR00_08090 [Lachnospiraceae bacterium]|nr:hypothetical protein [Lachnospiraceae bacterium]MEE3461826.1 hypothetical protein [Lachnospiraceae bacterium]